MAHRRRRKIKFSPFRISERSRKAILVTVGVFLMMIFAMPFRGSCRKTHQGGRGPQDVWAVLDGKSVTYGELHDLWRRWGMVFGTALDENQARAQIVQLREAEQAGIRVSDTEVVAAVRNQVFPRRVRVEYLIAESNTFEKKLGSDVPSDQRPKRAVELARQALVKVKTQIDAIVGRELEGALKRAAADSDLTFGETGHFTPRDASGELRAIREAPKIESLAFTEPIGQLTAPLRLTGGYCIVRVVNRARGFGPDGLYYKEQEGWVGHGYGVLNVKEYAETLKERQVTQAQLERTLREQLTVSLLTSLMARAAGSLPEAAVRDRYRRDNTQAVAAYYAIKTADFADSVSHTDDDLRAFYDKHKNQVHAPQRVGYLTPPRIRIEYVLGNVKDLAQTLDERALRAYHGRHRDEFTGSYDEALPRVRRAAADHELKRIISQIAGQAATEANAGRLPDLTALASQASRLAGGAFVCKLSKPFSAQNADSVVPELRGAKPKPLAEVLFGDQGRSYVAEGEERKPGTHVISDDVECEDGRFFFRVVERLPSQQVPYEDIADDTRNQLVKDYTEQEAFKQAQQTAAEYRRRIHKAAFDQFAERTGVKPVETGFLMADTPIAPLGQPLPALYDELARGEIGDLSTVAAAGDSFVLARLVDSEPTKGLKLQLAIAKAGGINEAYQASSFELQATYDADPYAYLDPPKPLAFDKVQADIAKLLKRRRALAAAAERIHAAVAELVAAPKPDLPAVAAKHKLAVHRNVKVDLARTEATPHVGKAAGFRDAVTALKPGEVSRALASADARFVFVVTARDAKSATIDVAETRYAQLLPTIKIEPKEVRQYYDGHRDTAYVTHDAITKAPAWDDLGKSPRDRVRKKLTDAWAQKPAPARFAQVRDSLVQEAFRTVPARSPVTASRPVKLTVRAVGPFALAKPRGVFARTPALLQAIRSLKVGEISAPMATDTDALLAFVADRRLGGEARASVAIFNASDYLDPSAKLPDQALKRYYDAHKNDFRVPETASIAYLFADAAPRQKAVVPKLSDDDCRRYYDANRARTYAGQTYDQAKARVRADLARERASTQARQDAEAALDALRKSPNAASAELAAVAARHGLTQGTSTAFPLRDPIVLPAVGRIRALARDLRDAKVGDLMPRVVATDRGYLVCRLAARDPERVPAFDEVRDRVRRTLLLDNAAKAARAAAERFHAAAARTSFENAIAALATRKPEVRRDLAVRAPRVVLAGKGAVPNLASAIFALQKPGLTPVVTDDAVPGACVAHVTTRKPDELLDLDLVTIHRWEVAARGIEADDDQLRKHYQEHNERFRVPDQLQIEYLAVTYDDLRKGLAATDKEILDEFERSKKARETLYKDWSKPGGLFFLPLEKASDMARHKVVGDKAKAQAHKLLTQALAALRKQGASADLKALAATLPHSKTGLSSYFGRDKKALEPVGRAPELIAQAFAAKQGQFLGPVFGPDGACVFRRNDFRPSKIPPFDEVQLSVEADLRRQRDIDRALALAGKLRARLAPAVAKATDKRAAFRQAVEAEPIAVEVPKPIRVTVTKPFYPLDAGWMRSSVIPGLGNRPALVRAVFRLRKGRLTPPVDDPARSACYVAMLTRLIQPPEPTERSLLETRSLLLRRTGNAFWQSWMEHLNDKLYASQ